MRPLSRYLLISAFVLSASIAFSVHTSADKPGAPKTDPRLAGVWQMQSGVNQGEPIPDDQVSGSRMIVRADSMVVLDKDANELYRCTYDFDGSTTPNSITMTSKMPDRKESKVRGVYKIANDELTICYALPGGERPQEFKSTKDGKTMLFKFKRLKDAD